jgi:hypothetical protein
MEVLLAESAGDRGLELEDLYKVMAIRTGIDLH